MSGNEVYPKIKFAAYSLEPVPVLSNNPSKVPKKYVLCSAHTSFKITMSLV
jgi:hypothetical protein